MDNMYHFCVEEANEIYKKKGSKIKTENLF